MMSEEANWLLAYANSAFDAVIKIPLKIENMSTNIAENNAISIKPYC